MQPALATSVPLPFTKATMIVSLPAPLKHQRGDTCKFKDFRTQTATVLLTSLKQEAAMEGTQLCHIGDVINWQPADEFGLDFRKFKKMLLISCKHLNIRRLHVLKKKKKRSVSGFS